MGLRPIPQIVKLSIIPETTNANTEELVVTVPVDFRIAVTEGAEQRAKEIDIFFRRRPPVSVDANVVETSTAVTGATRQTRTPSSNSVSAASADSGRRLLEVITVTS